MVENFHGSWHDGRAFAAMIDNFRDEMLDFYTFFGAKACCV